MFKPHGPEPGPRTSASLVSLPIEILTRILSTLRTHDLAQAAQACQALSAACDSAIGTFTRLDLKNVGAVLNDSTFSVLSKKLGPNLKRLEMDCWHLSDEALQNLPKGLEDFALCGCDHHSDAVLSFVTESTRGSLRRFAWSGFGGFTTAIGFERLLVQCQKLTSFKIDSLPTLDVNRVVCALADNCPLVNELSAFDLTLETFTHIKKCGIQLKKLRHKRRLRGSLPITDVTLVMITGMCPFLEELNLVDKAGFDFQTDLTDAGLLILAERASTLRKLRLKLAGPESALLCSEVALMELASLCGKLTHVELTNFKRLKDPPAYELIQRCPRLVEVGFSYSSITDATLELLTQQCKRIRNVSVKGCRLLTARGLKALGQCGTLEGLNAGQATGISDSVITTICTGNPKLKSLVLSFAQLTDNALRSISTRHQMQELAIHGCNRITNAGLCLIAKGCPQLRYISLSFCERISDSGIIALVHGCPQLVKVRLDGCKLLSNPCVRALCQQAPRLRYLSMQHCQKLSDDVFQHLLMGVSLRFVDLGSTKLSNESLQTYSMKRPHVELFHEGKRVIQRPSSSEVFEERPGELLPSPPDSPELPDYV